MALEGDFVVLRIVAEHRPACVELAAVANQHVPIMVADLMAEMPKQAAIGLGEFRAPLFDLR